MDLPRQSGDIFRNGVIITGSRQIAGLAYAAPEVAGYRVSGAGDPHNFMSAALIPLKVASFRS